MASIFKFDLNKFDSRFLRFLDRSIDRITFFRNLFFLSNFILSNWQTFFFFFFRIPFFRNLGQGSVQVRLGVSLGQVRLGVRLGQVRLVFLGQIRVVRVGQVRLGWLINSKEQPSNFEIMLFERTTSKSTTSFRFEYRNGLFLYWQQVTQYKFYQFQFETNFV